METYNGHVRTPADAILLFEACRIGLLPRVQRRLSEKERGSIKSGSVFVWDEREAGMRRWTDGKSWSASRVSGSFLTYREMEGKRGGSSYDKNAQRDGANGVLDSPDTEDGPDGYRYKPDGLMKQSFSITTNNGQHLHLISYFSRTSNSAQQLLQPSTDPQLRSIRPEKGMYPESTVNEHTAIPAVTRGPMHAPGYTHSSSQSYGRPPYGYAHPPAWAPPSPMHTPPPHGQYAPYYHPHTHHPQYAGQSPLQNMHYPPPPPHPHGPAPPMAAYDRPPHSNAPQHYYPPPPPQHHNGYSYPHSGYSYHPPPLQAPPQQYPQHSYEARPEAPAIQDPNSTEPTKDTRQDSHQSSNAEAFPAASADLQANAGAAPPLPAPVIAPANSGQTIPSINAMLNGVSDGVAPKRMSSRSPSAVSPRSLQDIPSHKLGFEANRDVQALRNLDKSTFKY